MTETLPRRKLYVNLPDLWTAMDDISWENHAYLDLATGEVCLVTEEIQHQLESIYVELYDETGRERQPIAAAIQQAGVPDWMKAALTLAHQIQSTYGERYLAIPHADAHEGYTDMQDFTATVAGHRAQDRLLDALHQRRPFRHFKEVLARYPRERERWFAFRDSRLQVRAQAWLAAQGLEPVPDSDWATAA